MSLHSRRPLVAPLAVAACIVVTVAGVAHRPPPVQAAGHTAPIMADVFYRDGTGQRYMITDVPGAGPDKFKAKRSGASEVTFWLDTIATITDTTEQDALITLKDGSHYRLGWVSGHLRGRDADDGNSDINLRRVTAVRFLYRPRRDQAGYAMFDSWKYSPYTGELLP